MTTAPLLYSYERMSTPEQMAGDSLRRQSQAAKDFATRHGYVLAEFAVQDLGVSAYRGANFWKGALGQFLKAVDDGQVPRGSSSAPRTWNRITRENPYDAQMLLREIFRRGISLLTYNDGRIYNEEKLRDDPMLSLLLQVNGYRGHDELKRKTERLKASWVGKRDRVGDQILTERAPAWLRVKRGKFQPIPERAAVVRRIFELAASGMGLEAIARTFNTEQVPTFGKARYWYRSYVLKIIQSPAPIGVFTPHTVDYVRDPSILGKGKRIRHPAKPIADYFPPVVDETLYQRVQAMRSRRAPSTRTVTIMNVLAGLAVCGTCMGSMTRVTKGSRARPYLVCRAAKSGAGCNYEAVRQDLVETELRKALPRIRPLVGNDREKALAEIEELEFELRSVSDKIGNLVHEISIAPSEALRSALAECEDEEGGLEAALHDLQQRVKPSMLLDKNELKRAATLEPQELNVLLRQVFKHVEVSNGGLKVRWKDERISIIRL